MSPSRPEASDKAVAHITYGSGDESFRGKENCRLVMTVLIFDLAKRVYRRCELLCQ
jgi:hypothetical protein